MKRIFVHSARILGMAAALGCTPASPNTDGTQSASAAESAAETSPAVATVNGRPIDADSVKRLMAQAPKIDDPRAALDILIRNRLLAEEAKRRGFDRFLEVEIARRNAGARALLKRETERLLTAQTVPMAEVEAYYESHKKQFVHGEMRQVVHFLARTGKKRLSEKEALRLAETAARAARGATDGKNFKSRMKPFKEKKKTVLESLPPFEADTRRLVQPFVEATFELAGIGAVSPPVKTEFGYHIIFIDKIVPPLSRSLEEAAPEIRETLLPKARKKRAAQLIAALKERQEVFVYEEALLKGALPSE